MGFPTIAELARRQTGQTYRPVMMLAGPKVRAVPVTIHIPLKDVPQAITVITQDLIRDQVTSEARQARMVHVNSFTHYLAVGRSVTN